MLPLPKIIRTPDIVCATKFVTLTDAENHILHGWIRLYKPFTYNCPIAIFTLIALYYVDTYILPIIKIYELIQNKQIEMDKHYKHTQQFKIKKWNNRIIINLWNKLKKLGSLIINPIVMTCDYVPIYAPEPMYNVNCIDSKYTQLLKKVGQTQLRSPNEGETLFFTTEIYISTKGCGSLKIQFSTLTPLQCKMGLIEFNISNIYKAALFVEWN